MLELAATGRCWVKLTGPCRIAAKELPYEEVDPFAQELIASSDSEWRLTNISSDLWENTMQYSGKSFDEIEIDTVFASQLTVTESHIVTGAGLFGDFNPLHVNDLYCKNTRFGRRILHGPLTSALMSASVGMYFAGTAIAYLEHNCQFKAPVYAGDTLTTRWTVSGRIPKPKINGGIAVLSGTCTNQDGVTVALAEGKIMLLASNK